MAQVFAGMFLALFLAYLACPAHSKGTRSRAQDARWLASPVARPAVYRTELWFLRYGAVWMFAFFCVIVFQLHESWHSRGLFLFMFLLALPLLLQPFLFPEITGEGNVPLARRFCLKATVWVAIFSFIGNWWYTHYFYSVLGAHYTMTSWDANGVPIPMYFATHFYFCFYHVLGNCVLRRIATSLPATPQRHCFSALAVLCAAYTTAFMETFTIAAYPCYRFDDYHHTATVGSAFYGIYFIVSFPMFFRISGGSWGGMEVSKSPPATAPTRTRSQKVKAKEAAKEKEGASRVTLFQAVMESCATGMIVLCLLDFVRVYLGQDLVVKLLRPCKTDMSMTCTPRAGVGFC